MIDQINQILNDPGSMQQIKELASAFGMDPGANAQGPASETIPGGVLKAIHQVKEKEEKQQNLVRALLPYLRPGHQKRLERAIQIARLSHLAGAALNDQKENMESEEASYDV